MHHNLFDKQTQNRLNQMHSNMNASKLPIPNNSDFTEMGQSMSSGLGGMIRGIFSSVPKWVFVAGIGGLLASLGGTIWLIVWAVQTIAAG